MVYGCSRVVQRNLFCHFWTSLQFFTNFGTVNYFWELNKLKMIKTTAQFRASNPAWGYSPQVWWAATRGWPKGRLGLRLVVRSSRGAACGGTLTDGPVAASRRQGVPREHQWGPGMAPGKAIGGGSHPNGDAAWRRWRSLRTTAFVGGESSGGRWQWSHIPAVAVRKREGEGGHNWGQWRRMGGSHREAAEAVVLGRNLARKGEGVSGGGSR
jgi:hypothetical protein